MEDNDVQEAKEYFRNILLRTKESSMAIVRLHGHRSQASASVQRACGKTLVDLKIFLLTHPDTFTVIEDDVSCTQRIEGISENPIEKAGKKEENDVQEAKEYFRNILLGEKKTLTIVRLHGHRSQAPAKVQRACGKSILDFKEFLLKYPETFSVTGNMVSCTREKGKVSEKPKQNIMKRIEKEKKKDKEPTPTSPKEIIQGITCHFEGNSWKEWKKALVATIKDCNSITHDILKFAAVDPMISLSCQSGCYNAKYQLCLLQIATRRGEAFVFDIMTCPKMMTEGGLKSVLESGNVMKVIHNCSTMSAYLQTDFGVLLKNVFDTQSAYAVLQFQNHRRSVNEVESISLNALCAIYGAPMNPLEKYLKQVLLRDENYWTRRPLSPDMLLYAVGDVLTLTNKELYQKISAILPENHELFRKLCEDQILRYISPKTVTATGNDREDLSKLSELNNNSIINDQDASLSKIDLTEEEQERPEKTDTVEKNPEALANKELDSDECDWGCVFEKTSNDVVDLVQRNVESSSVEMISSGNSESSDDTNLRSLIDSIYDDVNSGNMDDLEELIVPPAAVDSAQTSITTSMSAIDPVQDVRTESQLKTTEEVMPVIDLTTEGETSSFLPVPVIQNTQNALEGSNFRRSSQYDSVLMKRVTKRTAAEVIQQYKDYPPTKIPCLDLGEESPAFSPAETDESTSCQSSESSTPPHMVTWGIHFTYAHKKT